MTLKGEDVVREMLNIERAQESAGEPNVATGRVIARLAGVDEGDDTDEILMREAARVIALMRNVYAPMGVAPNQLNVAAIGFLQGVTFCAAARRLREACPGCGRIRRTEDWCEGCQKTTVDGYVWGCEECDFATSHYGEAGRHSLEAKHSLAITPNGKQRTG